MPGFPQPGIVLLLGEEERGARGGAPAAIWIWIWSGAQRAGSARCGPAECRAGCVGRGLLLPTDRPAWGAGAAAPGLAGLAVPGDKKTTNCLSGILYVFFACYCSVLPLDWTINREWFVLTLVLPISV